MLKVSVTYHLKSTLWGNEVGLIISSLILTDITYGLSLRNREKSLLNFKITDSNSFASKVLRRIGRTTLPELRTY